MKLLIAEIFMLGFVVGTIYGIGIHVAWLKMKAGKTNPPDYSESREKRLANDAKLKANWNLLKQMLFGGSK